MIYDSTNSSSAEFPHWQLDTIYPSFDSLEYREDSSRLDSDIEAFLHALESPWSENPEALGEQILGLIGLYDSAGNLEENLRAYAEAAFTVNTADARALREINALATRSLPLRKGATLLANRLAELEGLLPQLPGFADPLTPLGAYRFFIEESAHRSRFQMEADLEDLANDLDRSGADAWTRLHDSISANTVWMHEGELLTVTALRELAHHRDRDVRERAYLSELAAWKSVEIPLAAALNGVKGAAIALDTRRGWGASGEAAQGALEKSAFQSRIKVETLKTLISAIESSRPMFRGYLKTKASLLGVDTCRFYDLFAPVRRNGPAAKPLADTPPWPWERCAEFIPQCFDSFDLGMGAFARNAFALSWIDAQGRPGKVGGAYCTSFPLAGESRILCNYDGSFDSVTTVAHELGHAWHHELLKTVPRSLIQYPMTLAETASIFAETIVFESALAMVDNPFERATLIEGNLADCCQVLVDILSRFYFERDVFALRQERELVPSELCELMAAAQVKTYGDGLDSSALHPYMWAVKSHYYNSSLSFYNYPYAFGLLFSLSLFAEFQKAGPAFAASYRELLEHTGRASAEDLAATLGFNLEDPAFWQKGLDIIAHRADELATLASGF